MARTPGIGRHRPTSLWNVEVATGGVVRTSSISAGGSLIWAVIHGGLGRRISTWQVWTGQPKDALPWDTRAFTDGRIADVQFGCLTENLAPDSPNSAGPFVYRPAEGAGWLIVDRAGAFGWAVNKGVR